MRRAALPPEIEEYRDICWLREGTSSVKTVLQAEQFVQQVGFAACLTDARQSGAIPLCGGLRKTRCDHAAQRPEGRRKLARVAAQGRDAAPRPRLLWKTGARQGDVPVTGHDP